MMCNPNITPNGSEPTGSKTGNWQPDTNKLLCARLEVFEKSVQEMSRTIARLRDQWLGEQLILRGFPAELLEGVRKREPGSLRLAAYWVQLHGFEARYELLNTVELFQHGESVAFSKLFDLPRSYETETPTGY